VLFYVNVVDSCCTVVVQLLYSCSTVVVQLLYSCCAVVAQLLYSCCTVVVLLYSRNVVEMPRQLTKFRTCLVLNSLFTFLNQSRACSNIFHLLLQQVVNTVRMAAFHKTFLW
jgi:hypothetical protein